FITDIIVFIFIRISSKPGDKDHHYGHGKFETLATVIIGLILFIVGIRLMQSSGMTIYKAIKGTPVPQPNVLAFIVAIASVIIKYYMFVVTLKEGKKQHSPALIANAWHHNSDALSSIGAAIGIGGAILLGDKWTILDPIAAVVVSVLIMKIAVELMFSNLEILLEKSLPKEVEDKIVDIACSFNGVSDVHKLYTRMLGTAYAIEMHVGMDGRRSLKDTHDQATQIENALREHFGPHTHIVIHVEPMK
ncbi:MAG TPA: cation diffusion facilitator family transporter, partial [Bacteroidaceae bacterium]|nr:cation diffusion facilitator family transporter [Bacteroidaceae bacterium]